MSLTKEMIQNLHKLVRGGNVVLKIYMAKAYNSVDWSFLVHVIEAFGFSEYVCKIVSHCISSPWFSIVMNSVPKGFFHGSRGLRKRDPLSPYLFIMMEEVFSRLLEKKFQEGRIGSFSH